MASIATPSVKAASPADNLPAWYPAWARELADLYFSGTTCLFILHGNVHDLIHCHDGQEDAYCDLAEFLDSLPDNSERLLFKRRFDEYLAAGGRRPNITECVEYAIAPLVGDGKENLRTMRILGLEDAVAIAGQRRDKYGAIPPGLRPPG